MTAPEQTDDFKDWPSEPDPINTAICPLITAVFELTAPDSPERARAMNEVLAVAERIKQALVPLPRLQ